MIISFDRSRPLRRCRRAPLARLLRRAGTGIGREGQRVMDARAEFVPSVVDRIKATLVSLRMPRALEIVDAIVRQLERGEVSALEAIDAMLAEELTFAREPAHQDLARHGQALQHQDARRLRLRVPAVA